MKLIKQYKNKNETKTDTIKGKYPQHFEPIGSIIPTWSLVTNFSSTAYQNSICTIV